MTRLADKSIDLILTDLPYGTTQNAWDFVLPLDRLWKEWKRIIKPTTAIVLFSQLPFSITLAASNPRWLRYEWIWEKTCPTGFLNAKKMPLKSHENILVFYQKLPTYNPQWWYSHPYKTTRHDNSSTCYRDFDKPTTTISEDGRRYPTSVLRFKKDSPKRNGSHPTAKPEALCQYLIKTYSNEGDTVLDCCAGSGTTLIAAQNTARQWIGYETNPDYYAFALNRLTPKNLAI